MRIGLLGELEVIDDAGTPVTIRGAKLRALLAVLALQAGRPVPADQIVDALWGDDPPPAVRNGLQGLVSKLRRTLGATGRVAMRGGGYVLDVDRDRIDVHRFEQLVAEARAASGPGQAIARYAEASALWRGDALAEFAYEAFAATAITRLSELRLAALEERLGAELRCGRHLAAISELEGLVSAHPLREGLRSSLMLALYRAGRQADALRAFQHGRQLLADELGLDPGPELRQLEAAILAQDPSLDAPAVATPRTGGSRQDDIPEPLTPLVGREQEFHALTALVAVNRLVTLVGPGGVGKTRLALEVARTAAADLSDGGRLVELAPIGDPAGVRTAIAATLDLPDPSRLVETIGHRQLLLVLDNCEHVITEAAAVAEDLLRRCPRLRLVATSREGLRVPGEHVWPVPPLGTGDAVELFVDRARAAGGQVGATDLDVVGDICTRLDGLPLAIELAAARTRTFPVHQIGSRLHDRFRLLTGGSRTALPRQQTLRAVVDWSYDLLFADDQRTFERLSVFPGGCDLATARTVCAGGDLDPADLEDIIQTLIDKSLVLAVPAAGELRITQLQTLAQYGREKLSERGDAERIRDAMARHFARLCAGSARAFTGDEQRSWLQAVDRERENITAALEWAIDVGDADTALTIAGGASWPHWLSGTVVEGQRWLDAAFSLDAEASDHARALALTGRALLSFQAGIREGVDTDLEEALALFRRLGDRAGVAWAYSFWSEVAAVRGDLDEGRRRRREVLAFYESQPDDGFVRVVTAYVRAKLAQLDDDLAGAERWYRDATEGLTRIDRPIMRAMCLGMVAEFDERAGHFDRAVTALAEAVDTCEALGLRGLRGSLQARLGWALLHEGDHAQAEGEYSRALDHARRVDNPLVALVSLAGLAVLHRLHGRDAEAVEAATEAVQLFEVIGPRRMANRLRPHAEQAAGAAVACVVLAAAAAEAGDVDGAGQLLARADELRARAEAPVAPFQRDDVDRVRASLGS